MVMTRNSIGAFNEPNELFCTNSILHDFAARWKIVIAEQCSFILFYSWDLGSICREVHFLAPS